jgi:hypothetical protein
VGDDGLVRDVEVTIQFFSGCPNWQDALTRVREAAHEAGVAVTVTSVPVETLADAARVGFVGSPTVLVNGFDPFAVEGSVPALACRVYRTDAGTDGAPTVDQLAEVLRAATS